MRRRQELQKYGIDVQANVTEALRADIDTTPEPDVDAAIVEIFVGHDQDPSGWAGALIVDVKPPAPNCEPCLHTLVEEPSPVEIVTTVDAVASASDDLSFVFDSGAGMHMTSCLELLHNLRTVASPVRIRGAFGKTGHATRIRRLRTTWNGVNVVISNVLYVPDLGYNLLSGTTFLRDGFHWTGSPANGGHVIVTTPDGHEFLRFHLRNRLLRTEVSWRLPTDSSIPALTT